MTPILFAIVDAVLLEAKQENSFFCNLDEGDECPTCLKYEQNHGWWRSCWVTLKTGG